MNFIYVVSATSPCKNDTSSVKVHINGAPVISNVTTKCSAARTDYTATFNVTGGDRATYSGTPAGGTFSGTGPIYSFTSAAITSGIAETITITDGNGCASDATTVTRDCSCETVAGTMESATQNICNGQLTDPSIYLGGFNNDGNDTLSFYLHEGSTPLLENVIAVNDSAVFGFNSSMSFGTVYYISAGAGNDSSNFASRTDACFTSSSGTPVIFYPLPTATLSGTTNICPGNQAQLKIVLTAGMAPFDVGVYRSSVTGATGYDSTFSLQSPDSIAVTPPDTTQYELRFVRDANGCATNYATNTPVSVNVNTAPKAIISGNILCSDGASNKGSFDINVTGAGSQFTVVYQDSATKNSYTTPAFSPPSVNVVAGDYDPDKPSVYKLVSVTDNSGSICPGVVSGRTVIYPNPSSNLSSSQSTICTSDLVNLDFVFSGVGPWKVVYNSGASGALNDSLTTGNNPHTESLPNPGPGLYNYQIVSVTDLASGGPSCPGIGSGNAQITVNRPSKVDFRILDPVSNSLVKNDSYCDGNGPRNLHLILDPAQGSGNTFSVTYTVDGILQPVQTVTRPESILSVNPSVGTHAYEFFSITDQSSAFCPGTGDTAKIVVNPTPKVTRTVLDPVICLGDSASVQFTLTGNPPVNYTVTSGTFTQTFSDPAGTVIHKFKPSVTSSFSISGITDGSTPQCTATGPPNFQIKVNVAPTATMDKATVELCQGTTLKLFYTTTAATGFNVLTKIDSSNVQFDKKTETPGQHSYDIANLSPGVHIFRIDSVKDNSTYACVGTPGSQTVVTVRPTPTLTAAVVPSTICQNGTANLALNATGNGPFEITYEDDLNPGTFKTDSVKTNPTMISVPSTNLVGTRKFSFTKITDSSNPDGGNPLHCEANNPAAAVTLTINPNPTGALSGIADVCQGFTDSVLVTINTSSAYGPYTVNFKDEANNIYNFSNLASGPNKVNIGNNLQTNKTYDGLTITSSVTGCTGIGGGPAQINVHPNPQPDFSQDKMGGCSPLEVNFINLKETNYTSASCIWDFDDNSAQVNNCDSVKHTFNDQTYYDVSLTVTSDKGCVGSKKHTVVVYPDPVANFRWEPEPVTISNSFVRFFNTSFGGASYEWTIDSVGQFTSYEPTVQFPAEDSGTYNVCLKVTTGFGCVDTICKPLFINGELLVNIPNSFTPNQDEFNETWKPVIVGFRVDYYDLTVFDRWGQVLWHSNNPEEGWNGKDKQNNLAAEGVYAFRLQVKSKYSGEKINKVGNLNLVK